MSHSRSRGKFPDIHHFLKQEVKRSDGSLGRVYSCVVKKNVENWYCYVCDTKVGGPIEMHNAGRKHKSRLALPNHPVDLWKKFPDNTKQVVYDYRFTPGEPIPPGFESEAAPEASILKTLNALEDNTIIGLEYIVELTTIAPTGNKYKYVCMLCNDHNQTRDDIIKHLLEIRHQQLYIEKHFPFTYRFLNSYVCNTKYNERALVTLRKICEAITRRNSRLKPHSAQTDVFERNRQLYQDAIDNGFHFFDTETDNFKHLIDIKFITTEVVVKREVDSPLSDISSISSDSLTDDLTAEARDNSYSFWNKFYNTPRPTAKVLKVHKKRSRTRSKSPNNERHTTSVSNDRKRQKRTRSRSRSRSNRSRTESSRYSKRRSRSRSSSRSRSRNYRHRSRSGSRSPSYSLHHVKPFPLHRPLRIAPLNRIASKPYFQHDNRHYVPDISQRSAYEKRLIELNTEMFKILQTHEESPEDHPMYAKEWNQFWNRRYSELQSRNIDPSGYDFKPEWIEFWNRRVRDLHEIEFSAKRDDLLKEFDIHPNEVDPITFKLLVKETPYPKVVDVVDVIEEEKISKIEDLNSEIQVTEKDVNLVGSLRLLAAVEDRLGASLGPKIVDLLSKALSMEKTKANSSEELLDDDEALVLLETAKEKLKGQLLADLIESERAQKSIKEIIRKIAGLVHFANDKKRKKIVETPVKVPGIGAVDKASIAAQITVALLDQGRTDISTEELEKLIETVVGDAERQKKESDKIKTQINEKIETFSDSELLLLAKNFDELREEEQQRLINYLKTVEENDPARVAKLKSSIDFNKLMNRRLLNQSRNETDAAPFVDDNDDDDEDYNYEDMFKNVNKTLQENPIMPESVTNRNDQEVSVISEKTAAKPTLSFNANELLLENFAETQKLIDKIMSDLASKQKSSSILLPQGTSTNTSTPLVANGSKDNNPTISSTSTDDLPLSFPQNRDSDDNDRFSSNLFY